MPYLRALLISLTVLGWLLATNVVFAQTYGSQMMTPEERAAHRDTMQSLPPAEREAYRAQHHKEMQKRAEASGMSIPEEPPTSGMGQGRRYGPGWDRQHRWGPRAYGPRRFGYGRRHGAFGPWGPGYGWGRRGFGPGERGYGWDRRGFGPGGGGYGWGRRGYGPWGSGWGRSWY